MICDPIMLSKLIRKTLICQLPCMYVKHGVIRQYGSTEDIWNKEKKNTGKWRKLRN